VTEANPRQERITRLLAERYEVIEFLGEGGFAAVFQVVNPRLGRVEALKVLNADHSEEPDFARRFEQEARVAASLDHPGIVKIFDYGRVEELFWFTMQLVNGPTLVRVLKEKRRLEEKMAVRIAISVLDALDYSHGRGVIHRDIKPDNIILDSEGRPYLMDFGIAKSDSSLVRTRTGTVLGSPAYIAPEQLTNAPVDGRVDLFALGVTLYRMLSNAFPFYDEDPFRMATKRLTVPPEPLSARLPGVSRELEAIVMRALAREPENRFPSAGEMRDALRSIGDKSVSPARAPRAMASSSSSASEHAATGEPAARPSGISDAASFDSMPTIRTAPPTGPLRRSRRWWLAAIAGAVALLAAAAVMVVADRGATTTQAHATPVAPRPPASTTLSSREPEPLIPTALPSPAAAAVPFVATRSSSSLPSEPRPRRTPPSPSTLERPAPAPVRRLAQKPVEELEVPIEVSSDIAEKFGNRPVGLSVVIAEDGTVKKARVISPLCPECDRAALEAVTRFRFQPARDAEGKPMEAPYSLTLIIPAK
jgi:eukaryotic-like serine/threonine-protein kinase